MVVVLFLSLPPLAQSAEPPDVSITPEPIRYAFINGDSEKFQAHHWMRDRYVGGVKEFSLIRRLPHKVSAEIEGHAVVDDNDLAGHISIERENFGFVTLDYQEFRKYFDGTGGVYRLFNTLPVNELDRGLELHIGHLALEVGLTPEEWPDLVFFYEREFKDGVKSRLTWTAVREGSVTRNIGPSWQEIDEIVDIFGIRAEHEVAGFFTVLNARLPPAGQYPLTGRRQSSGRARRACVTSARARSHPKS